MCKNALFCRIYVGCLRGDEDTAKLTFIEMYPCDFKEEDRCDLKNRNPKASCKWCYNHDYDQYTECFTKKVLGKVLS